MRTTTKRSLANENNNDSQPSHRQQNNLSSKLRHERLKEAVRRDILFLFFVLLAYIIVAYVETHADDLQIRTLLDNYNIEGSCNTSTHTSSSNTQTKRILDAGFILTTPLHSYLASHRHINDLLAGLNSILLTLPLAYVVYVTIWLGDFRLSFRLIATHLFRTLCGWFTYLPPDPQFLSSLYDFPEIFLCLFQECSAHNNVNFLTFFSGHVATLVIIGNHLYMTKHTRLAVCLHCFNWLQAIRLLATRGHYSIDMIIGYVVAVWVSSPAERMGLYYSHGIQPAFPGIIETFEILIGVEKGESETNQTTVQASSDRRIGSHHHVQSETSVRIAVGIVTDIAQMKRE